MVAFPTVFKQVDLFLFLVDQFVDSKASGLQHRSRRCAQFDITVVYQCIYIKNIGEMLKDCWLNVFDVSKTDVAFRLEKTTWNWQYHGNYLVVRGCIPAGWREAQHLLSLSPGLKYGFWFECRHQRVPLDISSIVVQEIKEGRVWMDMSVHITYNNNNSRWWTEILE